MILRSNGIHTLVMCGVVTSGRRVVRPSLEEGRISIACRSHLLVILLVQLRHGRRESSEQTVGIIVDSRREEQRGAR
jgi:hypothetical protein